MSIHHALDMLFKFQDELERVQRSLADLDTPESDTEGALTLWHEMQHIESKLSDALDSIRWMKRPVRVEGHLLRRSDGRYILYEDTQTFFTSGDPLDVLVDADDPDSAHWVRTRMEHGGDDYYIVALGRGVPLQGLRVRVRETALGTSME